MSGWAGISERRAFVRSLHEGGSRLREIAAFLDVSARTVTRDAKALGLRFVAGRPKVAKKPRGGPGGWRTETCAACGATKKTRERGRRARKERVA